MVEKHWPIDLVGRVFRSGLWIARKEKYVKKQRAVVAAAMWEGV
jgi:hypothetical protein